MDVSALIDSVNQAKNVLNAYKSIGFLNRDKINGTIYPTIRQVLARGARNFDLGIDTIV